MQMCPKKYQEVFQQLYQYDVLAVSTNKKAIKNRVKQLELLGNLMSEIF